MLQITEEEGVRVTLGNPGEHLPQAKGAVLIFFFHIGFIVTQASLVAQMVKNLTAMQETQV